MKKGTIWQIAIYSLKINYYLVVTEVSFVKKHLNLLVTKGAMRHMTLFHSKELGICRTVKRVISKMGITLYF